jgi:uncharacterized HAD superfamily protein
MPFSPDVMLIIGTLAGVVSTLAITLWKLVQQMFENYREQIRTLLASQALEAQTNEKLIRLNEEQGLAIKTLRTDVAAQRKEISQLTGVIKDLIPLLQSVSKA